MTVRLTDVTDDAVTGTVSCAWSCRGADCASTAPRSHDDVPSALPQPKLKPGAPPLAGVACSRMVASGTFPPVVQALTVHCAEWPRTLLACARATATQRLICDACGTVLAPLRGLFLVVVGVGVGFAVSVRVRVGVGVALAEALTMARVWVADGVGRGVGVLLAGAFVVVFVAAGAGLDFSVRVGAAVALAEVVPESVGPGVEVPVVALAVAVGDGLDVVDASVAVGVLAVALWVVGVAVGVLGVVVGVVGVVVGGVGVCEGGVGEGDWLGGAAGSCSGSHD